MNKPLIICNGVIRSGSTWSFNVCRALVAGDSRYMTKDALDRYIRTEWKTATKPMVVKGHEVGLSALAALFSGRAKAVCTYRDPRDCLASDLTFIKRDFEYSMGRVAQSFSYLDHYLKNPHVLLVRYEQMMTNPSNQIRQIARHLNIAVDDPQIQQIDQQTGMAAAKELSDALATDANQPSIIMDSHRVDAATQLHENHIHSGDIGRWKKELTPQQIDIAQIVLAQWITKLGYEA